MPDPKTRRGPMSRPGAAALIGSLGALLAVALCLAAEAPPPPGATDAPGLGQLHYLVVFHRGPNWAPGKPYTQQPLLEHGKYLQSLYDRHILISAGPFMDNEGGFVLLDCPDEQAAKAIVADEPATRAGVFVSELHPIRYAFDQAAGRSVWPSASKPRPADRPL
jgi:uncharacterized protein YciI